MMPLSNDSLKIKIITTGGTIDKIYFDEKSSFQIGEPQAALVLREANVTLNYEIVSLLKKDSLDLTDKDREQILACVRDDPLKHFIITHGTDTMVKTAQILKKIKHKTIVLTGAMQPARFRQTDAVFNIACAVTAVQLLPNGVYLAMNGRIFNPDQVKKNRAKNRFDFIDR